LLALERRVLTGPAVGKPPYPFFGLIWPFLQFNAPDRRIGGLEELLPLRGRQAVGYGALGSQHEFLRTGKNFPQSGVQVRGCRDDALAVWAERHAVERALWYNAPTC
jgi:hypothetical protein